MSSRKYDSGTTTFSPEGRLYQVEYAIECINHAGVAIGILASDGIVLAAEKKIHSKLLDGEHNGVHSDISSEKMYLIDDHIAVAVAGLTSDANILINHARVTAQQYTFNLQEPMPVEQLIQNLSDLKHAYTQFGGQRPFGVSFLYGGWDVYFGFQLYHGDPSGNYGAWKANAIGSNSAAAVSMLKQEWKEGINAEDAVMLALKVLGKTMDASAMTAEKLEFATLKLNAKNKPQFHIMTTEELAVYVTKAKELHEKEEKEKEKKKDKDESSMKE